MLCCGRGGFQHFAELAAVCGSTSTGSATSVAWSILVQPAIQIVHALDTANSRAFFEISRVQKVCWNLRWAFANTARSNSTKQPRVKIPIGTEEQNVDRALLDPAPVGQDMPRDFWAASGIHYRGISQTVLRRQFCQTLIAFTGVLRIWALRARDLPSSWPLGSRSRSFSHRIGIQATTASYQKELFSNCSNIIYIYIYTHIYVIILYI